MSRIRRKHPKEHRGERRGRRLRGCSCYPSCWTATRCVIDGMPRDQIQRLVGHRDSDVIDRYIRIYCGEHRQRLEAVRFDPDQSNAESGHDAPPDTKATKGRDQ